MAEIISRFDLVAVQEVRDNLQAFNRLVSFLGRDWRYLFTDVTEGRAGNRERVAFLYDSNKVSFSGLAGEVQLPPKLTGKSSRPSLQLARSPYIAGFSVGWFKFALCTTHILYGRSVSIEPRRLREIEDLVQFLVARSASACPDARNSVLLGDFNIFDTTDATLSAITSQGFIVPESVLRQTTNVNRDKHFDQVAFKGSDLQSDRIVGLPGGAFHFFDHLYRDEDERVYTPAMGQAYKITKAGVIRDAAQRRRYYRDWRTYQMSDHAPLWVEIPIDYSVDYLQAKAKTPTRKKPPMSSSRKASPRDTSPKKAAAKKAAPPKLEATRRRGVVVVADTAMFAASPPPPPSG